MASGVCRSKEGHNNIIFLLLKQYNYIEGSKDTFFNSHTEREREREKEREIAQERNKRIITGWFNIDTLMFNGVASVW